MARCEICGRKINPIQRWCGPKACKNEGDILPRCTKCGRIIFIGMDKCPKDKMACIPDNPVGTILDKATYDKKVV